MPAAVGSTIVRPVLLAPPKQDVSPADFAMAKEKFRVDALNIRRQRFYQSYMEKARAKLKIDIDNEALKRAIG